MGLGITPAQQFYYTETIYGGGKKMIEFNTGLPTKGCINTL